MIRGRFTGLAYQSPDKIYTVFWFKMKNRNVQVIYQGWNAPNTGEHEFMLTGRWSNNEKYGPQFYVDNYELAQPFIDRNKQKINQILDRLTPLPD